MTVPGEPQMLTRDQMRVVKYARSSTFVVPPPPSLGSLPDEIWHKSEPYPDPRTYTFWVSFWSDNGEKFAVDTGQPVEPVSIKPKRGWGG